MQEVIRFFYKKPQKSPQKKEDFEIKNSFEDIKNSIIKLIKSCDKELILDFRCGFSRINIIREFFEAIFTNLLEILGNKANLDVKLLLNIDDWLIHKLDYLFIQLIRNISLKNFKFKVPIDGRKKEFRIISDKQVLFHIIGIYEFTGDEFGLIINNKSTAKGASYEFNQIWEESLDIREIMMNYSINKELEGTIIESEKIIK